MLQLLIKNSIFKFLHYPAICKCRERGAPAAAAEAAAAAAVAATGGAGSGVDHDLEAAAGTPPSLAPTEEGAGRDPIADWLRSAQLQRPLSPDSEAMSRLVLVKTSSRLGCNLSILSDAYSSKVQSGNSLLISFCRSLLHVPSTNALSLIDGAEQVEMAVYNRRLAEEALRRSIATASALLEDATPSGTETREEAGGAPGWMEAVKEEEEEEEETEEVFV